MKYNQSALFKCGTTPSLKRTAQCHLFSLSMLLRVTTVIVQPVMSCTGTTYNQALTHHCKHEQLSTAGLSSRRHISVPEVPAITMSSSGSSTRSCWFSAVRSKPPLGGLRCPPPDTCLTSYLHPHPKQNSHCCHNGGKAVTPTEKGTLHPEGHTR